MNEVTSDTTLVELAAIVSQRLRDDGISAVLVGGAVVSIYTHNKYQSRDLDYISPNFQDEIKKSLEKIGFRKAGVRDYCNPNCKFTVEFPDSVVNLGNDSPVRVTHEVQIDGKTIKLLSPTQCVMDRLLWFLQKATDRQSLDNAVNVCIAQPAVNLAKVKTFSEREGELEKYEIFLAHLNLRRSQEK